MAARRADRIRFLAPVTRRFCGECGTPLTYQHASRTDAIDLTTARLTSLSCCSDQGDWTEHRISWEVVNAALPRIRVAGLDTVPKES